ncbi:MAG TPA: trigger factor [Desulfobacteraceae bacterium]|nr:trigger factor [Desulfobacteraceae bacterium]
MQVKIQDQSSVKKVLSFEIPKEKVAKELNKAYNELKKNADIKGFRKGKVPRKVLENRFSADVHADVAPRLIQDVFVEAIQEHKLNIVGSPQMDPPELQPDADYVFDVTVEVKPELDDIAFEGLELEKTKYEVSEEEIESQIHMIRKTMARKETVTEERPVKEDDFVLIDYEGFLNGEAFDATPKVENYVMGINQGALPKEFSEKLIGTIPVQELEIEVPYADDFYDENLKGKTVLYKVTLKEIQEEVLPEANDDLVKDLGKFETLDEVKDSIRDNLKKGIDQRVKHELSEQIFQELLGKMDFELPEAMVEAELNGIIAETEQAFSQNNKTLEEVGLDKEEMKVKYRDVAEKQARRHLILDKLIDQEKLDMTEEEMDASFEEMAQAMNASTDAVKNYFNMDPRQLEYFKHTQLEKKAIDLIIEKGNVTEVEPKTDAPEAEEEAADGAAED